MKLAVLSGKGGTGKTFVSVNLAAAAVQSAYIDCDVEEPNGRLFLKPEKLTKQVVNTKLPVFDSEKCTGCRKCVDFCRFNALVYVKDKPMVFPEVCHSCGGCVLVCPTGAISETDKPVGVVECGQNGDIRVVTGCMNLGEAISTPIIKAALAQAGEADGLTVIDCPPGSACSVMESVQDADYCLLVAEPTAFGLHNFKMVYELVTLLQKPCGVIINKADDGYAALEGFCESNGIPVLCRIPYSEKLARLGANGEIAALADREYADLFQCLLADIRKEAQL
ncbi:MAG: 4Fe-4S binding protein [Clostridiales bacterium]|nr:4Fe-4S binding protein [Clostridiales bacterium]